MITFLMVFLIQQSQNKDSVALHFKLNELLAANRSASDPLVGIEDATEDNLRRIADAFFPVAKGWTKDRGARSNVEASVSAARENCQKPASPNTEAK